MNLSKKTAKEPDKIFSSHRLAVPTLLGTVAFVSTGFLPTPVDKMFVMIQALTFALGSLMMARSGGTYASLINGILLSILRPAFFPFSLIFSLFYGLLIDGFFQVFRVNKDNHVKGARLIISLALGTSITGLLSMYLTTIIGLMPMAPIIYSAILAIGILNGVAAGYLTLLIWNKYVARRIQGIT